MKHTTLLAAYIMASACTVIRLNDDDTTTIEHEGGAETAQNLATRVCRRLGQQTAEIISMVNKDAALPPGSGTQVSTFRCLAAERK